MGRAERIHCLEQVWEGEAGGGRDAQGLILGCFLELAVSRRCSRCAGEIADEIGAIWESPNAFPFPVRVQVGVPCFGTRHPLHCTTFWDGAWDGGRQGMGGPESPRLCLRKMQGFERAL